MLRFFFCVTVPTHPHYFDFVHERKCNNYSSFGSKQKQEIYLFCVCVSVVGVVRLRVGWIATFFTSTVKLPGPSADLSVRSNAFLAWCLFNPLTPNDAYSGRNAPLTSKRSILYIYSTNIGIEYFKHGIYSPFLPLQNAVRFIILTYLVPVLFTFYIQVC